MTIYAITDSNGHVLRLEQADQKPEYQGLGVEPLVQSDLRTAVPGKGAVRAKNGTLYRQDDRALADAQAERWEAIKAERAARLTGRFTAAGVDFDCNQAAMAGATLAAFMAKLAGGGTAASYRQLWVTADNASVRLTADEMIAVGQAAAAYVTGLWDTSQGLRKEIDEAKTPADVDAIAWPAG